MFSPRSPLVSLLVSVNTQRTSVNYSQRGGEGTVESFACEVFYIKQEFP